MKLYAATVQCDDKDVGTTEVYIIKNCRTIKGAEKKLMQHLKEHDELEAIEKLYIQVYPLYLAKDVTAI